MIFLLGASNKARLYVNVVPQPVLVVNDLKHWDGTGPVALWNRIWHGRLFLPKSPDI